MIALPSPDLPPLIRLQLLTEHAELELLKVLVQAGTPPAIAISQLTPPDRKQES